MYDNDFDYCFVCSRPTDHVGEHEALVAAGMAAYDGGTVTRTATYDREAAVVIADAEYRALYGHDDAEREAGAATLATYGVTLTR